VPRDADLDKIHITDLALRCVLGLTAEERREKQDVVINITLVTDLRTAGRTDRLDDSVDYKSIKKKVIALVEASAFFLLERLAERIAEVCLEDARVRQVTVQVEKPGALRFARSVGVEISRKNRSKQ
jgi:D-erythro-7,8-dihydroneopterin triphosphate epimerase